MYTINFIVFKDLNSELLGTSQEVNVYLFCSKFIECMISIAQNNGNISHDTICLHIHIISPFFVSSFRECGARRSYLPTYKYFFNVVYAGINLSGTCTSNINKYTRQRATNIHIVSLCAVDLRYITVSETENGIRSKWEWRPTTTFISPRASDT